ncbi:DUF2510 domain-containing protein [Thalassiella azotivora]
MGKKDRMQVQMSCRDCALCTGNAFTGSMRGAGRAMTNVSTLGLAGKLRSTCRGCGHPMSEHHPAQQMAPQVHVVAVPQPVQPPPPAGPPPGWYPAPDNQHLVRWWDGYRWTEHAQPRQPQVQQPAPQQLPPRQPQQQLPAGPPRQPQQQPQVQQPAPQQLPQRPPQPAQPPNAQRAAPVQHPPNPQG